MLPNICFYLNKFSEIFCYDLYNPIYEGPSKFNAYETATGHWFNWQQTDASHSLADWHKFRPLTYHNNTHIRLTVFVFFGGDGVLKRKIADVHAAEIFGKITKNNNIYIFLPICRQHEKLQIIQYTNKWTRKRNGIKNNSLKAKEKHKQCI